MAPEKVTLAMGRPETKVALLSTSWVTRQTLCRHAVLRFPKGDAYADRTHYVFHKAVYR